MKLLLTSAGFTNDILISTFRSMVDKPLDQISLAFITTASNVEQDTTYMQNDIERLKNLTIQNIHFIDIASDEKDIWSQQMKNADVIYVEGGNTFYLLDEVRKSGFATVLKQCLDHSVYVGVSAGSILVTPTIAIAGVEPGDPNDVNLTDFTALGLVPFEVSPHTPDIVLWENVEQYAQSTSHPLYAYDNNCAIKVVDGKVEVVGGGEWKVFNQ